MAKKPSIAVKKLRGEHDYSLDDDSFGRKRRCITQTAYYKGDGFILALGELNRANCWDDERFDAICKAVTGALNAEGQSS